MTSYLAELTILISVADMKAVEEESRNAELLGRDPDYSEAHRYVKRKCLVDMRHMQMCRDATKNERSDGIGCLLVDYNGETMLTAESYEEMCNLMKAAHAKG
jgi:hypothetical protein